MHPKQESSLKIKIHPFLTNKLIKLLICSTNIRRWLELKINVKLFKISRC